MAEEPRELVAGRECVPGPDRPRADRAVVGGEVEGADGDATGIEALGERLVEGDVDIAVLEDGLGDPGEDRELRCERRAALREAGVQHHLALELPEHAPRVLPLEVVHRFEPERGCVTGRGREHGAERVQQLHQLGRPRQQIVRAGAAGELAIRRLDIARRDEEHRHRVELRILAHRHREAEPIELRHHHVGDQHVREPATDRRERRHAIADGLDLEAEPREPVGHQLELHRIVVGDHHAPPGADPIALWHGNREVRFDDRDQPARGDRLRDDVVEPDTRDACIVELGDEAGEREDRDIGSLGEQPELADQLEAIRIGQHQILQHDTGMLAAHQLAGGLAIGRFENVVAIALERAADHPAGRRVVVDDQDLVRDVRHVLGTLRRRWFAIVSGSERVSIGLVM